mgnify:CR=1 FL=1
MQQIWSATGRRKRASAQVRIASPGTGTIQINQVDAQVYLQGKYPNILKPLQLCLLYTSPSPRDKRQSRMPSSA